jgi:hypothetical protein
MTIAATGATTGNSDQVRVGPGQLLVAPYGTVCPTHLADLATLDAAWRDVGFTTGGSTLTYAQTTGAISVAERLRPLKHVVTDVAMTMAFDMAQVNVENLRLATNSPTSAVVTQTDETLFVWPKEGGSQRFSILWVAVDALEAQVLVKCFGGGTITIPRQKGTTPASIAVSFDVEENSDATIAGGRDAYNMISNDLLA